MFGRLCKFGFLAVTAFILLYVRAPHEEHGWTRIADGMTAEVWMEQKLHQSSPQEDVRVHYQVRNKSFANLKLVDCYRPLPLHLFPSNAFGGVACDMNGWTENYVTGFDWREFLPQGQYRSDPRERTRDLAPGEAYDWYTPFVGLTGEKFSRRYHGQSEQVVTSIGGIAVHCGLFSETIAAESPWWIRLFGGYRGAQGKVSSVI